MNSIKAHQERLAAISIQRKYRDYKKKHKAATTIQTFAYLWRDQQCYNKNQIIKAVKAVNANERCPIGFERFRAKDIVITDCLHVFNKKDLAKWVKNSASCPTCRDVIQPFMSSESRLLNAASCGNTVTLQKLLSRGVDSQYRDEYGNTALYLAIKNSHVECARLLLNPDYRADLSNKNNDGDTPIHLAVRKGHLGIVRVLIDANVNLKTKNNCDETPFSSSIFTNNDAISEALIEAGADINMRIGNNWRPIHEAAYNGRTQLVQLLINRGGLFRTCNYFKSDTSSLGI